MGGERDDDDWDTGATHVALPQTSQRDRVYLIVVAGDNLGEMHEVGFSEVLIGRSDRANIPLRDDGVSRTHARVRRDGDAVIVEDLGSRNGTVVNGRRIDAAATLHDGDKIHVGDRTILRLAYHDAIDDAFQRQLYEASMYDALTRAYSRRYFFDRLEAELRYSQRHQVPLALMLLDLDYLKDVNDRYGHAAGDRVLAELAMAVHAHVRLEDLFGRLGGDEFGILCRGTPRPIAEAFAARLRSLVETLAIDVGDTTARVTVSIGIAAYPEVGAESPRALLDAADRALYIAKARGRNQIAVQPDEGDTRQLVRAASEPAEPDGDEPDSKT